MRAGLFASFPCLYKNSDKTCEAACFSDAVERQAGKGKLSLCPGQFWGYNFD